MATPKAVPMLDDTPKPPRIIPKRCPACQRPNKPDAARCGVCGFDFSGPPPVLGKRPAAKATKSGGGGAKIVLMAAVIVLLAGAGGIAYLGLDRALALAQNLYKPAPAAPPSPRVVAQTAARDARRKAIESLKTNASTCFAQFNELMDRANRPAVDPNALLLSYLTNARQLNAATTVIAECGGDLTVADAQKTELCDAAAQLKTCLSTVMTMERDRLQAVGYRINGSALERIKP